MSTAHATFETAQEFFPTPRALVEKMCAPLLERVERGEGLAILDPQAGFGDMLIPFARFYNVALYAIEQSLELRTILASRTRNDCISETAEQDGEAYYSFRSFGRDTKLAHVIGNDFFAYGPRYKLDAIVMNPPFSNWLAHLQHAIKIAQPGTEIYCLLPTGQKKKLKGVAPFGAEIVDCGEAFVEAARKTSIEVSYITFRVPEAADVDVFGFNFAHVLVDNSRAPTAPVINESDETAVTLAPTEIDRITREYDFAVRGLQAFAHSWKILDAAGTPFSMRPGDFMAGGECATCDFNTALKKLQRAAWERVFERTRISGFMTEAMRKKFSLFQETTAALDFNAVNIRSLLQTLVDSRKQINTECVLDVFKTLTNHSQHNRHAGWKTNKEHKVGNKVILPHLVTPSKWGVSTCHSSRQVADDIDRALCMVTGRPFDAIAGLGDGLQNFCRQNQAAQKENNTFATEFFRVRVHQSGTVHLTFIHATVLEAFNRAVVAAHANAASIGRE